MRTLPLTRRSWVTSVARSARSFSRCLTLAPSTLMPCTTCGHAQNRSACGESLDRACRVTGKGQVDSVTELLLI